VSGVVWWCGQWRVMGGLWVMGATAAAAAAAAVVVVVAVAAVVVVVLKDRGLVALLRRRWSLAHLVLSCLLVSLTEHSMQRNATVGRRATCRESDRSRNAAQHNANHACTRVGVPLLTNRSSEDK
jgi:hypothetical protein